MPSEKACVFCNRPLSQSGRAKEHVFPQWLLRRCGWTQTQVAGSWISMSGQTRSTRRMAMSQLVLGSVCSSCNNGWMSSIEADVKKIYERLEPLIVAKVSLSVSEADTLATWAVKTAMTLNKSSNYRDLFRPEELQYLATHRKPSHNCYVDMLWVCGLPEIKWRQSQWIIGLVPSEPLYHESLKHSFRITFFAGHLLFRVLVFDGNLLEASMGSYPTSRLWPQVNRQRILRRLPPVDIDDFDLDLGIRSREKLLR